MNGQIVSFDLSVFLMRYSVEDVSEVGGEIRIVCLGLGLHPAEKDEIRDAVQTMLGKRVVFSLQAL